MKKEEGIFGEVLKGAHTKVLFNLILRDLAHDNVITILRLWVHGYIELLSTLLQLDCLCASIFRSIIQTLKYGTFWTTSWFLEILMHIKCFIYLLKPQITLLTCGNVYYFTLRSNLSLNNPHNILWKYEVDILKIIIIIIGYTLNTFIIHITVW